MRRSEDHEEEAERHGDLRDKTGDKRIVAWRMLRVAVRGETAVEVETGRAARDEIENRRSEHGSDYLRHDIRKKIARRETVACPEANGNRGIQMTSRDMADRIGHGEHREAEGKRHAKKPDADVRKRGRNHRAATSSQHKPRGSNALCR